MKLAFNTWVYSSFPVWVPSYPLDETIERIAKIGYDGIEIGAAAPHAYPDYLSTERRRDNSLRVKSSLSVELFRLVLILKLVGQGHRPDLQTAVESAGLGEQA